MDSPVHYFAVHQVVLDRTFKTETFYLTDLLTTEVVGLGRVVTIFAIGRRGHEIFGFSFAQGAANQDPPIVVRRLSAGVWERVEKTGEWVEAWLKQNPDAVKDGRKRVADSLIIGYY